MTAAARARTVSRFVQWVVGDVGGGGVDEMAGLTPRDPPGQPAPPDLYAQQLQAVPNEVGFDSLPQEEVVAHRPVLHRDRRDLGRHLLNARGEVNW